MTMRRLPDGRYTESVDEYHAAWDALAAPLATLGWVLSSYDPGLVLYDEQGHIVTLKVHQAQRIGDALRALQAQVKQLRARLADCRPWVGVCPWPGTPAWSEVIAARELADDTLEEIKP